MLPTNANDSIVSNSVPSLNVTLVKLVHPSNASLDIVLTDAGISIVSSAVHCLNASGAI